MKNCIGGTRPSCVYTYNACIESNIIKCWKFGLFHCDRVWTRKGCVTTTWLKQEMCMVVRCELNIIVHNKFSHIMLMGGRLYGILYASHNCSINESTLEKINNGLDVMAYIMLIVIVLMKLYCVDCEHFYSIYSNIDRTKHIFM